MFSGLLTGINILSILSLAFLLTSFSKTAICLAALSLTNELTKQEIKTIENRVKEYGSWQSQLDEIYHEGLDAWKTRIASIKAKYPK